MTPPHEREPATVLVVKGGDVPFRTWMRLTGTKSGQRRKRVVKQRRCVACGVACTPDGVRWSKDHIIPQARLTHVPELVHSPLNHQWMCRSGGTPTDRDWPTGRLWVGCNETKGNGQAVDYRGDPDKYRRLVALARDLGITEDVGWDPLPWRGIGVPVPQVV